MPDVPGNATLRRDFNNAFNDYESVTYLSTKDCLIETTNTGVVLICAKKIISLQNTFVFIRIRGRQSAFVALLCMLLEKWGVPFNDAINAAHQDSANKSFCIPRLAQHGLPVPHTIITSFRGLESNIEYVRSKISYPCVIKGDGARGTRVFKVISEVELFEKAKMLTESKAGLLTIQEFIPNTYDVRALFMGEIFIAAMRRSAVSGGFLNNVSQGGRPESEALNDQELTLCKKAVRLSGLDLCGVDFIRKDNGGIVFLEINKSPQIKGIRSVNPELSVGSAVRAFIERL